MEDFPERIARLRKLTPRERETLTLLCAGLTHNEIAERMVCSKSTVLFHLCHVYEKLGLGGMASAVRQREIGKFCLAFQEMSQAEAAAMSAEAARPEPEVESEADTEPDLTHVPQRALVAVLMDSENDDTYRPLSFSETGETPSVLQPSRRWLRSLLILFGTAVVGGVVGAAMTALILGAGRAPRVREVVVTATPRLAVTGVASRTGSTEKPVQTRPVPRASSTLTLLSSPTVPPTATALTGSLHLAGKVPSDIPGVLVAPGTTISSVVDQQTKPRDVYAVQLAAGQTLQLNLGVKAGLFAYRIEIANPDAVSFATGVWHGQTLCDYYNASCQAAFSPAVAGTYYVAVVALDSTVAYTLHLSMR